VDDAVRSELEAVLDRLRDDGCPFVGSSRDVIIDIGVRRWGSFERRNHRRRPGREDRIADLARGLYERLQPKEHQFTSDPLMRDVECVARAVADALDPNL